MFGAHSPSYDDRNKEQKFIEILFSNLKDTPSQPETVFVEVPYYLHLKLDNIILNYNKNINLIKYNYDGEDELALLQVINSPSKNDYWLFGNTFSIKKYTKNDIENLLKQRNLNYENIYLDSEYFLFHVKHN